MIDPIHAAVGLVFLLAGLVKGTLGLGLPTVAVGLLGLMMPPAEAASLLIVPSLATNLWQLAVGPALGPLLRRLKTMMAGICLGTWAGIGLFTAESRTDTGLLGLALAAYAVLGLLKIRGAVRPGAEPWLSPLVGAATGAVTAATGVFVMPAVPYLQGLDLERDELVQAMGLSFTVSTLALTVGLSGGGALSLATAGASLLALGPALLGMALGQWLRRRIEPEVFRRAFLVGLLLLGGHLAFVGFA